MTEQKNKIATVERLISVVPHPNADRLDLVKVLGYQCVTERGLHQAGDLIIYIQPDSVLPDPNANNVIDPAWAESYRKYSPSRIKAVKLRGEFSEGIIVKFEQLPISKCTIAPAGELEEGYDVSDLLGIKHYEPPLPQDLSAKGLLPFGIPKTDETRWENKISSLPFGERVNVTLKIDGQSWSCYYKVDTKEFGVLGRTMEYKDDAVNKYTEHIERYDIKNKLIAYCERHNVSLCLRGESYGKGIQTGAHNYHSTLDNALGIFSVYLIDERRYAGPGDPFYFLSVCADLKIPHVPLVENDVVLTQELIDKYSTGIKKIDGKPFEGVVINHGAYTITQDIVLPPSDENPNGCAFTDVKHFDPGSFKVINKPYDTTK